MEGETVEYDLLVLVPPHDEGLPRAIVASTAARPGDDLDQVPAAVSKPPPRPSG
ncbi:MAG TPA: hypothetical protein VIO34_09735 [Candidatus Dormibacteraeota bacterium]|jgi:hypothetical protein